MLHEIMPIEQSGGVGQAHLEEGVLILGFDLGHPRVHVAFHASKRRHVSGATVRFWRCRDGTEQAGNRVGGKRLSMISVTMSGRAVGPQKQEVVPQTCSDGQCSVRFCDGVISAAKRLDFDFKIIR